MKSKLFHLGPPNIQGAKLCVATPKCMLLQLQNCERPSIRVLTNPPILTIWALRCKWNAWLVVELKRECYFKYKTVNTGHSRVKVLADRYRYEHLPFFQRAGVNRVSIPLDNEPKPTGQRAIVSRLLSPFGNRHFSN